MGGAKPLYALIGLGLPGDISVDFVDKLYIGLNKASSKYGFIIAGGDTVSTKKDIVISITLIGEIDKKRLITRSGARPGDLVFVSGSFGDSAAGLYLLEKGRKNAASYTKKLIEKHLLPVPRLEAAIKLADTGCVTSMIDASDGLDASLKFITQKSRAGAEIDIDKIPVSKELLELSFKDSSVNPLRLALGGGEDYELVFTARPGAIETVKRAAKDITCIGVVTKKKELKYISNGTPVKFGKLGYQAFTK
jgi:thiamine-monophosphate kinase